MQTAQQLGNYHGFTQRQGTATQSEVQTLTGGATSGNFRLRFGTLFDYQETGNIAFNASAATIQTALRALSNIGSTGVNCAGGPLNTTPVTCTFVGPYAAVDVPLLQVVSVDLAGGTVTPSATTPMTSVAFAAPVIMDNVATMRARLAAISGTTFTTAVLEKMTENDMVYALRVLDYPQTV